MSVVYATPPLNWWCFARGKTDTREKYLIQSLEHLGLNDTQLGSNRRNLSVGFPTSDATTVGLKSDKRDCVTRFASPLL